MLPAAFPNLLVNGATGIAVGMATNMAPHNLVEVVGAARHLIAHPEATLDELMEFVPGPDLPTGGTIVGLDGIRDAYATGRGSFKTRAKVAIEQLGPPHRAGRHRAALPRRPREGHREDQGRRQRQEAHRHLRRHRPHRPHHGLRLVIGIKTGFNPEAVLEQLYRLTPLEDSFNINNVALVDGQPQTLGLRELLASTSSTASAWSRGGPPSASPREERLHLVEGLLIAILDIDEVIQVIRTSRRRGRGPRG